MSEEIKFRALAPRDEDTEPSYKKAPEPEAETSKGKWKALSESKVRETEAIALAASSEWGESKRTDEDTFAYNWSSLENVGGIYGLTVGILGLGEIGAELARRWEAIPKDTEVLITHGPPLGIGDQTSSGQQAGCALLRKRVEAIKPKIHAFGHIHEAYGRTQLGQTLCINASICTLAYQPIQDPVLIHLKNAQVSQDPNNCIQ